MGDSKEFTELECDTVTGCFCCHRSVCEMPFFSRYFTINALSGIADWMHVGTKATLP